MRRPRPSRLQTSLALVLLLSGCKTPNKHAHKLQVLDARKDSGSSCSSADANQTPGVFVSGIVPSHLTTGLSPAAVVRLKVTTRNVPLHDAVNQVKAGFLLTMLPSRTPIAGDWTSTTDGTMTKLVFTPKLTLAANQEYLINLPQTALIKSQRAVYAFRVGSLPRVSSVYFEPSAGNKARVDMLIIRFSEFVKTDAVASALKVSVGGKAVTLSLVNPGRSNPSVLLTQVGGMDATSEHTIEIGTDVGLPAKLDSDYVGKESASAFRITLKPSDYAGIKPWRPNLTF